MRYRPRQVCLCDPNRLLSSLPRFSAHCHARSLLPTVVNHSTIYDENPDLHHGLLGVLAISVILLVSTAIALITGVSLAFPGTFLDRIWALNRGAYIEFVTLGRPAGISLMILGLICAIAAAGLLKRRKWAWWLAVGLFVVNVAGDAARTRSRVREYFGIRSSH